MPDRLPSPRPIPVRAALGVVTLVLSIAACGASTPSGARNMPGSSGLPGASTAPSVDAAPSGAPPEAPPILGEAPPSPAPQPSAAPDPGASPFPGGLIVADRGNGRILILGPDGQVQWQFPVAGSLPPGQRFAADDAFLSPDGRTITANDETHQVVDRIDIATHRIVWQYGHYGRAGSAAGYLHNPDDAYPLANGDVVVADIVNCRILEIAPSGQVARTIGRTGVCRALAPTTYNEPNGDTPLPDGGVLITEIRGSRVVRLSSTGAVIFDIHVPARYPSDAQLDANGNVVVADYSNPGAVLGVSPTGRLLWRYAPTAGSGRLDHPSLATPLPDGNVAVNDDFRHRIVIIDPRTLRIVWQYGHTDVAGRGPGYLNTPDGHQPLPAGFTVS